jgi:hypothetical protein
MMPMLAVAEVVASVAVVAGFTAGASGAAGCTLAAFTAALEGFTVAAIVMRAVYAPHIR